MQNERPGRTLQTTALVHEAYLRLIDSQLGASRPLFRLIGADYAPHSGGWSAGARDGGMQHVNLDKIALDEIADVSSGRGDELIALDEALEKPYRPHPVLGHTQPTPKEMRR
jgi:RNA polymerase sigma-70 factor (ECF subfamily)